MKFQSTDLSKTSTKKLSKRLILSQIARIFDPQGFVAAFIVRAKIGRQELWEKGVEWDEKLPAMGDDKRISLFEEMKELNNLTVERCHIPFTLLVNLFFAYSRMHQKKHLELLLIADGLLSMVPLTSDLQQRSRELLH